MIATVHIDASGTVVVCLDSDDAPDSEDECTLMGLRADSMLEQCSRVALEAYFSIHDQDAGE